MTYPGSSYIHIFYTAKDAEIKREDGVQTRWKLIAEFNDPKTKKLGLQWIYTYNPKLVEQGMKNVQFYRDAQWRLCVRVPKKTSYTRL